MASNNSTNTVITSKLFLTLIGYKNQFLPFKHLVRSYRAMNFEQFTSTLIQEHKHVYTDFVQLALISLVIPVSSAPCERGFSVQNSIKKTKLRNRRNP